MPRQARDKSDTGIYHIMLRGINRQKVFHDDKEFNEHFNEDVCLDEEAKRRLTDEEARTEIMKIIIGRGLDKVQGLPKKDRNEIINDVKKIEGVSQRQAARILGISENIFFKV